MVFLIFVLVTVGCSLLLPSATHAQISKHVDISGIVVDHQGHPIAYVGVQVNALAERIHSDESGHFNIAIPASMDSVTLRFSCVGKRNVVISLNKKDFVDKLRITMYDNSLTLEEVNVSHSQEATNNSISSIVFDEEAIERVQAFSLMDVLNTLPGRQTVAPNINSPQTLTLRNTLGGAHDLNNSLGIPIIMDGVVLSNDANMQSRPIGQWSMGSGALPATLNGNTADVPFRGIDLREIPVESIERIEVIQGVASPEYGEMTDGAILIERKAGRSPLQFTTNVNATAYNYSLNKGVNLPKKWGGVTMDLNYALSNSNPTNNFQEYRRYGVGLRWNTVQYKHFRNKLSVDFNSKADEGKLDPDDNSRLKYYSTNKGVRVSNTASFNLSEGWINNINFTNSLSIADQDSYAQRMLNQGIKMFANKDTTGVYEGIVMNAQYLTIEEIIGRPVTASANLKFNSNFSYLNSRHTLSYGINGNYNNNGGKGIVSDPDYPRWFNHAGQNSRPYAFELTPDVINYGIYLSDNIQYRLLDKNWSSSVGFRLDQQNGSWSFQPRLNTQVSLSPRFNVAAAYGISSKSPTLAQVYPTPAWLDIPLLTVTSSGYSPVYLVYTQKMQTTNLDLKPMRNSQAEVNLTYRGKKFSSRLNAYYKDFKNGFNSFSNYLNIQVPVYEAYEDADQGKIVYYPTGEYRPINDVSYNRIGNQENSYTYGFDWSISLDKIPLINTSISTSTSYIISKENSEDIYNYVDLKTPVPYHGQNIWQVLYSPLTQDKRYILTSKFNTTTHIPKLGFVVMTNTDIFWQNRFGSLYKDTYQPAVGYLDPVSMQTVLLAGTSGPDLPARDLKLASSMQRIIYASFNMSVAKEISRKIRIAITTYNTFNIRPQYTYSNNGEEVITVYNSPLSITGGITIKL